MLTPTSFFNLDDFPFRDIFTSCTYAWDALKHISFYCEHKTEPAFEHRCLADGVPLSDPFIFHNGRLRSGREATISYGDPTKGGLIVRENGQLLQGASVIMAGAVMTGKRISLGKGVLIESGAMVKGPVLIGDETEIRHGAYVRGNCIIGNGCVIGHSTEIKHSIFLNKAKAGHFAYVGDSILGENVNLGAGTKCANLRFLGGTITVVTPKEKIESELKKFGVIMGDEAQTGCNAVTSPGTLMGPGSILMPNTTAPSGFHQPRSIIR